MPIEWLKWNDDVEEWGEIECPMLGNEMVMTYYPKGCPCYYSYTAPFVNEDGDIGYYRSGRLQDRQPFRRSEAVSVHCQGADGGAEGTALR